MEQLRSSSQPPLQSLSPAPPHQSMAASALASLVGGPWCDVALWLDVKALGRTDATCQQLFNLNSGAPWRNVSARDFFGMECGSAGLALPSPDIGWKHKCEVWQRTALSFFNYGREIHTIRQHDVTVICGCRLRIDLLRIADLERHPRNMERRHAPAPPSNMEGGVYYEVEVVANPDSICIAVCDFDTTIQNTVTFNPETGGVIRERRQHFPRGAQDDDPANPSGGGLPCSCKSERIEGEYMVLLPRLGPRTDVGPHDGGWASWGIREPQCFQGFMGVYVSPTTDVAFFRQHAAFGHTVAPCWETTGFCTNLWNKWGLCGDLRKTKRATMCLSFRDRGDYIVKMLKVSKSPPFMPPVTVPAYVGKLQPWH